MSDETVMSGMPRHVREAAENAKTSEMTAAAGLNPGASVVTVTDVPAEATQVPAGQQQPPADRGAADGQQPEGAVVTDDKPKEMSITELKERLEEIEKENLDYRNRLRRHQGQQRVAREAMEREVASLKAELAKRDSDTGPAKIESDDAFLIRNGYSQEEIDDMRDIDKKIACRTLRKVEETSKSFSQERDEIKRSLSERKGQGKLSAVDAAVEESRPGFLASIQAGSDSEADWSLFGSEVNPDSATGLTWKETLDIARKVGDKATILRVADLFAKDARLSFKPSSAKAEAGATRVEVPVRRVMPSSGPSVPIVETASRDDANASKRTYARSYSERFHQTAASRQGSTFRPFTITAGGTSKTFNTIKEMEKERDALLDAADEGRIVKG